jgi:phosphoglycerate kinase
VTSLPQLESLPDVAGKRVFVRVDFNVPLAAGGVADDGRIRAALPTIAWLRERGARIVIASHLGRPQGMFDARYSLKPVARRLGELLESEVACTQDCIGERTRARVAELGDGGLIVLENLRFHAGETEGDPAFASELDMPALRSCQR